MLDKIKEQAQKAKQFAQKHPTLVACVATAVVTHKMTHAADLNRMTESIADEAYEWGRENGVLTLQNAVMLDFINQRQLGGDLQRFIVSLKDTDWEA